MASPFILVIVSCLTTDPSVCKEERLPSWETPVACVYQYPRIVAEWATKSENASRVLKRVDCVVREKDTPPA